MILLYLTTLDIMEKTLTKLNYIGSKYSLLNFIESSIIKHTGWNVSELNGKILGDLFSGTSAVSFHFKKLGCSIISNDMEYYGNVVAKAYTQCSFSPKLQTIIDDINKLINDNTNHSKKSLVMNNYTPHLDCERMYFTVENGHRIDLIREKLEDLKTKKIINDNEYFFLLGSLLVSADKIANIPAVYCLYLKKFKKSSEKELTLEPIHKSQITEFETDCVENNDIINVIDNHKYDIIYLDPPYNERQYSKNYHVLNYIAKYNETEEIYGKTGLLKNSNKSNFCSKKTIKDSFKAIVDKIKTDKLTQYLFLSYNNEGLISHNELQEILSTLGEVKLETIEYKRFKNFKYNETGKTNEYLFCVKCNYS